VESAGIIGDLFFSGDVNPIVATEGNAGSPPERQRLRLRVDEASEKLFTTLRTPLLRGRFFSIEDGPDSRVAIINDAMARRLWPGREAVGRRFKFGPRDSGRWFTVIGVVGDMRRQGLDTEPIPQMFQPLAQNPSAKETLLVRTASDDPLKMAATIRAAIARVDKGAPLYGITTLERRLADSLTPRRFQTSLLIGFSVVALLMAAIGIYGLLRYSVATRTQEIGIRMAVGAQAGDILGMIVGEGLKLGVTGLVLGILGALWVTRIGSSLLFGVTATDPLTFTTAAALMIIVAAAASYFPARRAIKVEPTVALRQE